MSLVIGKEVVRWVAQKTNEFGDFGTEIGIGLERNSALVGGIAYANWNGVNVEAHAASDGSKTWLTRQFLWTIFDYPFNQLQCKRITLCIGEGNKDSRRFAEHLGFELEATLKNAHPSGHLLIFVMWKEHCRWINENLYPMRIRLAA